jgi:hypothetical protein
METVAGVFRDSESARRAAGDLARAGFPRDQVNLLLPGATEREVHSISTSETEQPGVGGAIGGVVGGAIGLAGGFELGVAATALIPGVGPVLAVGVAAAALLGAGGATAGAMLGGAADAQSTEGVPSDEVFFYEDALRQGRSLVITLAKSSAEAKSARILLAAAGAESLDAARENWWLGLRDVEQEHYRALGHNFELDQDAYRAGFESALRIECRGKSLDQASDCLKWWHPDTWDSEAFRRGFERGVAYRERQGVSAAGSAR